MKKLTVLAEIDTDSLFESIWRHMSSDDMLDFIKLLEEQACDISFTKKLYEYTKDILETEGELT